jgi:hypothetical protein
MDEISIGSNFLKPVKWLVLAFSVKLLLYFLFIYPDNNPLRIFSGPFIKSADHAEYITPIDNLIEKGTYSLDGSEYPYAGRLPGFIFPYVVFRAIFNEGVSNILLGAFILVLSVIASYVLSLLLFNLTKERWAFITGFLLINFTPYFWHYDWTLHTSSLGISCLIFFAYYFHSYITLQNKKHLIYAGFFLAWLILLRGFCLVYLPIVIVFLFAFEKKAGKNFKQVILATSILLLPFAIAETAWITRNYISLKKIVPLQTSFVPGNDSKNQEYGYRSITKYSLTKVRELIFTWGGENAWYFPDSDISWFAWKGGDYRSTVKFEKSIFFNGFNLDTLLALRNDVIFSYRDSLSDAQHDSIENKIVRTAERLKEKFKTNKMAYFYLKAPIKRTKNYLIQNTTQDWPGPLFKESNIFQKGVRFISLTGYAILLLQILLFPILYIKNFKMLGFSNFYLLCYSLLLASIFPFAFLIVMAHYTYFIFGFTLLIPIFVFNVNTLFFRAKE